MSKIMVYAWTRPDGTPFYVGVGRGRRPWVRQRNRLATALRRRFEEAGQAITVEVLREHDTVEDAYEEEARLIAEHGRIDLGTGCLANMTSGGEGCNQPGPEVREHMSRMKKGVPNPRLSETQKGRPATEAQRAALLEAARRPKSAEHREKIRQAKLGQTHTEETKARISEAKRGTVISDEHRRAVGDAHRGQKRSPEWKAAISAGLLRMNAEKKTRNHHDGDSIQNPR